MARTTRRQYGEGTIVEYRTNAGVRYRAMWLEPTDPENPSAESRRKSKGGFITKRDASDHLLDVRAALRRGERTGDDPITLEEHVEPWLDGLRLSPVTVAWYRRLWRLHVKDYLGSKPLGQIRPAHLAAHYRFLETGDPDTKRKALGPASVIKVHGLLSVALQAAVEDETIGLATNPARSKRAKPPTPREVKSRRRRVEVWPAPILSRFLKWAHKNEPDMYEVYALAASTGMRRGELIELRWSDIDLSGAAIHVQRAASVVKVKGQPDKLVIGPTKNGRDRRIDLDRETVSMLRSLRQRLASEDLRRTARDSLVLTLSSGARVRPDHLTRRWSTAVRRFTKTQADGTVPYLSVHGLRHTHASILLADGEQPKVVQERLGHETLAITQDLYGHVMPNAQKSAAARFGRLLHGRP